MHSWSATKKSACPRCRGSGFIEENVTLVGIAPLLDRPSAVNDEEWELPGREPGEEKTAICHVPTFKLPRRVDIDHALPVILRDSEHALPRVHQRAEIMPGPRPRRLGVVVALVASLALGAALGAFTGVRRSLWLPVVERAFGPQRSVNR